VVGVFLLLLISLDLFVSFCIRCNLLSQNACRSSALPLVADFVPRCCVFCLLYILLGSLVAVQIFNCIMCVSLILTVQIIVWFINNCTIYIYFSVLRIFIFVLCWLVASNILFKNCISFISVHSWICLSVYLVLQTFLGWFGGLDCFCVF
jgi:hypothetical protein